MKIDLKSIHIGSLIYQKVIENNLENSRICNFLKCSEQDIKQMYEAKGLETEILLRWSKLLEYDFFRMYSQHLILYAPKASGNNNIKSKEKKSQLPQFKKNIYTREIIDFVINLVKSGEMTRKQVIERYNIPKATLYKWISKY